MYINTHTQYHCNQIYFSGFSVQGYCMCSHEMCFCMCSHDICCVLCRMPLDTADTPFSLTHATSTL